MSKKLSFSGIRNPFSLLGFADSPTSQKKTNHQKHTSRSVLFGKMHNSHKNSSESDHSSVGRRDLSPTANRDFPRRPEGARTAWAPCFSSGVQWLGFALYNGMCSALPCVRLAFRGLAAEGWKMPVTPCSPNTCFRSTQPLPGCGGDETNTVAEELPNLYDFKSRSLQIWVYILRGMRIQTRTCRVLSHPYSWCETADRSRARKFTVWEGAPTKPAASSIVFRRAPPMVQGCTCAKKLLGSWENY
jgi:hypothetical protein